MTKSKQSAALESVKVCCRILDEKKAEALKVLDVSAQSSLTDYLILATATSEPHLRALRVELEKALDARGSRLIGIEMAPESGWVVIDLFDVMVHLFLPSVREHYGLERLWHDAPEVTVTSIVAKPPTRKSGAAPRRRATGKTAGGGARKRRSGKGSG